MLGASESPTEAYAAYAAGSGTKEATTQMDRFHRPAQSIAECTQLLIRSRRVLCHGSGSRLLLR